MEEKRSNVGLIIVCITFIIISIGLAGFIAYDKFYNKEKEEDSTFIDNCAKATKQEEIEKITLAEVKELFGSMNNRAGTYLFNTLVNHESLKQLTNEEILEYAFYLLDVDADVNLFESSELEDVLANSFLGDLKFTNGDIKDSAGFTIYSYDSSSKSYIMQSNPGHGGTGGITFFGIDYDFYEENGKYYLIRYGVYNTYHDLGPNAAEYYGKYEDIENNKALFENPYEIGTDSGNYFDPADKIKENFEEYKENLTKLTFTFAKENGQVKLIDYIRE